MIISIFTPHGGCPEKCHFCDQSVSGGAPVSLSHIRKHIEDCLNTKSKKLEQTTVAFYGGTFTAMPRATQVRYLEAVLPYIQTGQVQSIRLATRPDALEDVDWLKQLLDRYCVSTIEIGIQSFNPAVLSALGRTHTIEHSRSAVLKLKNLGFRVGAHIMVGCPGETPLDDEVTIQELKNLMPDMVRIHPLLVLSKTPLEQMVAQKKFEPLSLDQAISRCAALTEKIEGYGMKIIRLGLQPNELLGQSIVAGPYHSAFGELVRGRIYRNKIEHKLRVQPPHFGAHLEIQVPIRAISSVKGPHKSNLDWLKEQFHLSTIRLDVLKDTAYEPYFFQMRISHPHRPA